MSAREDEGKVALTRLSMEDLNVLLSPNGEPQAIPQRFRRWTVPELLSADLTSQWDMVGMLVRPTHGVDAGELKTLKSYFGLSRIIALAGGVPMLGRFEVPSRCRVLAYVAEGGRIPFTRRLQRLSAAHGVDDSSLEGWLAIVFDAAGMNDATFLDMLRIHLRDFRPAFVHLDPLYAFQPSTVDSNRLTQVGAMLTGLQLLCAEYGATLWLTAHMNQTGTGFDLKRISGAGISEWVDSWTLLRHREPPNVERGRFRLELEIGSRQWGGATYEVDYNIGRFDSLTGMHDGPLTFAVRASREVEAVDKDAPKRLIARNAVLTVMKRAKSPKVLTEIVDRCARSGVAEKFFAVAVRELVDECQLIEVGSRTPAHGGRTVPVYMLAPEARK